VPASDTSARSATASIDPEAHLLVVDDDAEIRHLIGRFLRQHGFRITGARDGREMRGALGNADINLVILDLMLPGTSGLQLCREIRAGSSLPIIMLTAKGEDTDRIVGLEVGADDYLTKPFNPRELLARVRAVLRRAATPERPMTTTREVTFAGWRLDTMRRQLLSPAGIVIELSGGEYYLLVAFVENPNRVLSRDRLLELARNRLPSSFDRTIDVQVSRLRRKLEREDSSGLIKTVRGAGYFFAASPVRR
jgi:two-component system, OmpR family, response regulator